MVSLTFCAWFAVAVTAQQNRNAPEAWFQFDSHESAAGPKLLVYGDDREPQAIPITADATIISYLADRPWGRLPWLAVDMRAANCTLLRFDLQGTTKVRKAELVLNHRLSPQPPTKAVDIGFYEIKESWAENQVTWKSQPAIDESPALIVAVDPRPGEIRLDVTSLAERLAGRDSPGHGWLLKVVNPVGGSRMQYPDLESDFLNAVAWENSADQAIQKAQTDKKLILTVVRGSWDGQRTTLSEQLLLSTVLAEPDVLTLIRQRFVPLRVSYQPSVFTHSSPPQPDPLAPLGTTTRQTKALALVVSNAAGTVVSRLCNIGTYDRDLVLKFLLDSIAQSGPTRDAGGAWKLLEHGDLDAAHGQFLEMNSREGQYGLARIASLSGDHRSALRIVEPLVRASGPFQHEAEVEAGYSLLRLGRSIEARDMLFIAARENAGNRSAEAGYYLGCLLHRAGDLAQAAQEWKQVVRNHAQSPFALKAKARLAWPDQMAIYENLEALELPSKLESTERTVLDRGEVPVVERATDYLLRQQQPDGSWPVAKSEQWQAAVTALVARSLHRWQRELSGERADRMRVATQRATEWLGGQIEQSDPKTMDSFGAAYVLDYFVDLEETNATAKGDTQKAIQFLLDGQCPNGAWSYSHRFGTSWKGGFGGWPATTKGRVHSVNTGPALLALARSQRLDFHVDPAALDAGTKVLAAMRSAPGVYTYTYPEPISFREPDQSIARGPVCEEALSRLGVVQKDDLKTTIDTFMKYRADLRLPVKLDESWSHPHAFSSYFYFFAYAHAASAIAYHGEDSAARLRLLRDDILRVAEIDGTWVDFEVVGKPYATAMALYILHLAREADTTKGKSKD